MKRIFTYYLKPYYLRMTEGFLLKFIGTLMDLFLPWTLAYMIDTVIPADDRHQILFWGLFMVVCSVLAVLFSVWANRMASRVASDAIYVVREDLFAKVMYLSSGRSDEFTRPSLISRLTTDTYNVHQMIGRIQRLGVRAPILLIGGIVMTMMLDPVMSGILLCTLPLLALIVWVVSSKSIPMFTSLQECVDRFVRLVREDIAGIRVIKALSKGDYERERFDRINQEVVDKERKATIVMAISNPAMNVLLNLGLVAVIIAGAVRVNAGTSEVGKILAFMTYFTIILNALMSISRMFIIISKAAASASRIMKVMDAEDERELTGAVNGDRSKEHLSKNEWKRRQTAKNRGKSSFHVEFCHVSFSYDKVENNLEDISFQLKRGETLGIIGPTGSGKTTIASLLMRLYDADRGQIRIEGQDVTQVELEGLRQKFGVVFQNDTVFENTISQNILMSRDLTEAQVMEAAVYARAEEFIGEKGGIFQDLDIKGANLSGGQKQRLFIARALAAHPEILILDDSSSALDYKTDAALRKELREHFADTTCIIIAQRISSIMGADHILVLEDGKMAGYGTHEQLLECCQGYREIRHSQMGE